MTYVTIILMPRSASDENQMPINLPSRNTSGLSCLDIMLPAIVTRRRSQSRQICRHAVDRRAQDFEPRWGIQ
ncbi:hypothetical protein RHECIAT_CH0002755 [Rhizobium etli CIAT 652]|uniref:Uncharacterized protein n=1 Tax=Rhizobium etli (strain CIAT 652) TaxID=491916 RepID=B3PSK9_RHIE6|nr:hypothetical protein RHECIAT_CH0002755 [Rhizobium etli CIAT 652]